MKTSVELPEVVWKAAKHRAVEERKSLAGVIEAALRQYLSNEIGELPKKAGRN